MNYLIIIGVFICIVIFLFAITPKDGDIVPSVNLRKYDNMNSIPLKESPHDKIMEEIKDEKNAWAYRPRTPKPAGDSHIDYTNWPI